jgi:EmrB/QacA subfamily drug resistance transporter
MSERPEPLTGSTLALAFTGLMLGNTMAGIDATIVATAAPTITSELGRLSLLPWIATSYLLAQTASMPLYGKLGDLYGRRRVFLGAIGVFLLGSVLCGAAQSMAQLVAFRALQGAGAGGLTGVTMALVADIAPPARLGRLLGLTGLAFAVSSVIGPLAGGLFVDHLTWRWAFYVNVPGGLLAVAVVAATVPAFRPGIAHRLDVLGAGLLMTTTTALVLVASLGGVEVAWSSPVIVGLAAGAVALGAAFVAWEQRAREPVLPLALFRSRAVSVAVAANLVAGVSFFGAVVYLPVFFQEVAGRGATESGALLIPFALSTALSTFAVGELVDRGAPIRWFPVIGMCASAVGFLLLSRVEARTGVAVLSALGVLVGMGVGGVMQVLLLVVQRSAPPRDLGVATSATVMARIVGASLGVATLGAVFNNRREAGVAVADALASTFLAAVPIMLVGLAIALRLPRDVDAGEHAPVRERGMPASANPVVQRPVRSGDA